MGAGIPPKRSPKTTCAMGRTIIGQAYETTVHCIAGSSRVKSRHGIVARRVSVAIPLLTSRVMMRERPR